MFAKRYFVFVLFSVLILMIAGCCLLPSPTPKTHTVTATAGAGGSITPSGAISITEGANQTFTITADTGYEISDVLVDGISVGAVSSYTFNSVQEDHTIQVIFIQQTTPAPAPTPSPSVYYTITASAGTGGSITPEGSVKVKKGKDQTYTITPLLCYQVSDILVDGESVGAVTSYTFNNIQKSHTIQVNFAESGLGIYNMDQEKNYQTIQAAILDALDGETIIVCPGTYYENLEFAGRNITLRSADPSDPDIVAATTIDGGGINNVTMGRESNRQLVVGSVVLFINSDTSTLAGFTIRGGKAYVGGGIAINQSSPTITYNTITGNTASYGGGISMALSSPTINNNTITGNTATHDGGGIYMYEGGSPSINGNYIEGNTAITRGGGIFIKQCTPSISNNNTITNNTATYGGGIYLYESSGSVSVTNNMITYNKADYGGGIYVRYDSYLLPSGDRPNGWGIRESIPILSGDPLDPAEGEEYEIAGNTFLGNGRGDSLEYNWGAHLYYDT